jgi:hypothetical protein
MRAVDPLEAGRELGTLEGASSDPSVREALRVLGDAISVGNISHATGVAIGREIRQVINRFELSPDAAAALIDLRAMHGEALGLDATQYRWGPLLIDRTEHFVGRGYVFEAIERFLGSTAGGYLLIQGPPGLGKSSLLAEYVRRTGCIAHFNSRALGVTSTSQFVQSVCAQLIADAGLPYPALPPDATNDGAFLLKLLQEARERRAPDERLVIAVDALDEVDLASQPEGANVLFLPPALPDGVYVVMTRRNADMPLTTRAPVHVLDLLSHPAENRADVETYIGAALARTALSRWVARHDLTESEFVVTVADLSESNFMYLHHVLPEIEGGAYRDLAINELPAGLVGYYEDHWRHMGMTAKPLPRVKLRIVYILCEARQPLSRALLSRFATDAELEVDQLQVQEVLDEWKQFLLDDHVEQETRYGMYHVSFREFLHRKDIVQAAGLTIEGVNALIADTLWADVFGTEAT